MGWREIEFLDHFNFDISSFHIYESGALKSSQHKMNKNKNVMQNFN